MIYASGLHRDIYLELMKRFPQGTLRNYGDVQKLSKLPVTNQDIFVIFNWGKGARKIQQELLKKRANQYPDVEFSLLINNKIKQLQTLDAMTKYPLERIFVENHTYQTITTPTLSNSAKVVTKIGNDHQGINKFLYTPGKQFKTKESVIFEEFVDDARSLRVAIIGEDQTVFLIEHQNSEHALDNPKTAWIKNMHPIETVYSYEERYELNIPNIDDIIEDTRKIATKYKQSFLGVDYVIAPHKTGFLEANDMIGLPAEERIFETALQWFTSILEKYATT